MVRDGDVLVIRRHGVGGYTVRYEVTGAADAANRKTEPMHGTIRS